MYTWDLGVIRDLNGTGVLCPRDEPLYHLEKKRDSYTTNLKEEVETGLNTDGVIDHQRLQT